MHESDAFDILLVEDNPHDVELTLRALARRKLANPIHVVEDGAAALDFLFCRGANAARDPSRLPKVVLLDLKLPKVSARIPHIAGGISGEFIARAFSYLA